jgi:endonuclease/exonuclease/phosphatase family metal-dependent hydrolase
MSQLFNEWIDRWGLIDIKDPARTFTWSNNQEQHVLATLDRVLVSIGWDAKYPLARVKILPKGSSDHNPLAITFGNKKSRY